MNQEPLWCEPAALTTRPSGHEYVYLSFAFSHDYDQRTFTVPTSTVRDGPIFRAAVPADLKHVENVGMYYVHSSSDGLVVSASVFRSRRGWIGSRSTQ